MKFKIFVSYTLFIIICVAGCKDSKVNVDMGSGSITYEGKSYSLNFSTIITTTTGDGRYDHNIIMTDTENGNNVFSFSATDDYSKNEISVGVYEATLHGDYTAHFSIDGGISDSLTGTMTVTLSGDNHVFHFEGSTIDENVPLKTVIFTYTGKIKETD